jgi:predicted  nucleic acid-binding Zn-ribbon protein
MVLLSSQAGTVDSRTTAHLESQLAAARGREELLHEQIHRLESALEAAAVQRSTLEQSLQAAEHSIQHEAQLRADTGSQLIAAGNRAM